MLLIRCNPIENSQLPSRSRLDKEVITYKPAHQNRHLPSTCHHHIDFRNILTHHYQTSITLINSTLYPQLYSSSSTVHARTRITISLMDFLLLAILTFPFFLLCTPSASSFCPITTCTNNTATPVRFPFRIDHQQLKNCSYPGFDLYCTDQGATGLNLPHSGNFLVRYISYQTQNIRIYDPNSCLPQRLLDGFDPSGSPFQADFYVNYTFLRCPKNFTNEHFRIIDCLSNSTTSVVATSHSMFALEASNKSCEKIRELPVPISWPSKDDFTSSLSDDIWLYWDIPGCQDCEQDGGVCGFKSSDRQRQRQRQIGCFYGSVGSGHSEQADDGKGIKIFRIIAFSIAAPAILCAMGVGIFLCVMDRRDARGRANRRALRQIASTVQPPEGSTGLDQATIDSYTKVVLGESRRVPGLNDGSCPICLSDFSAKETLRCIPDCQHCFHAECLDEWLKMNGTCPVCRNSPAHHLQV